MRFLVKLLVEQQEDHAGDYCAHQGVNEHRLGADDVGFHHRGVRNVLFHGQDEHRAQRPSQAVAAGGAAHRFFQHGASRANTSAGFSGAL